MAYLSAVDAIFFKLPRRFPSGLLQEQLVMYSFSARRQWSARSALRCRALPLCPSAKTINDAFFFR